MYVEFFYGPGSRYSYLAATQIDAVRARTGATFRWRVVFSKDLIARSGRADPFASDAVRGSYEPSYRTLDVARWARHYGVRWAEPDVEAVDWKYIALWCAGAELLGEGFGREALDDAFALGAPPAGLEALRCAATRAGLDATRLEELVSGGEAERRYAENLTDALAAGAFGVPTFICADGSLFWGQDRLPLLVDHLRSLKSGGATPR